MNTASFKSIAKKGVMTIAEVGTVVGTALLTTKFLDANILFKDQIAKDPTYVNKFYVKYQAPFKLAAGALGAAYFKNPWVKLGFFGLAVAGGIGTVRLMTAKDDGTNFFQSVGSSDLDKRLREWASMNGPYSKTFQTNVGKPVDLMNPDYTSVAGAYSQSFKTNVGEPAFMRGPLFMQGPGATGCASTM